MELSPLAGNRALKTQLSQQEEGRGLSHAYILSGPAGSGKHTLARLLCGAMLCTAPVERRPCGHCGPCKKVLSGIHPDVAVISGPAQGKPITVDQVRQLRADAYIRPNEGERKVYLLEGADRMNASAQNAMLKLLEEGPAYAAFLLLAENGGGVLQTVRSRCVEWKLRGEDEDARDDAARDLCRAFASGQLLPVSQYLVGLENKRLKREQLQQLLENAWRASAEALLAACGKPDPADIPGAEELRRGLTVRQLQGMTDLMKQYCLECRYNVGVGHVLGALCAGWEKLL